MTLQPALYSSEQVCAIAGVTYRQVDYWTRNGFLSPDAPAAGSGVPRRYTWPAIVVAAVLGTFARLSGSKHGTRIPHAHAIEGVVLECRERGALLVITEAGIWPMADVDGIGAAYVVDVATVEYGLVERRPVVHNDPTTTATT